MPDKDSSRSSQFASLTRPKSASNRSPIRSLEAVVGGQEGGRGYLIQTLIVVIESLSEPDWTHVRVEPDVSNEKVDVLWTYPENTRAVQVKSSQNTITVPDIRRWATSLEESRSANSYALILIGPSSVQGSHFLAYGSVKVKGPQPLDIRSLIDQAAHRLDVWCTSLGHPGLTPTGREVVVQALATKLLTLASSGEELRRQAFIDTLDTWLKQFRPGFLRPAAHVPESVIPRQLPPVPKHFVGREQQLGRLRREIELGAKIVGIQGMPGIGKSSLAVALAKNLASHFLHGEIFIDMRGLDDEPLSVDKAMRHVVRSIRPDLVVENDAQVEAIYRSVLDTRAVIILADNVHSRTQVESLAAGGIAVIVYTSRLRLVVPGAVCIELAELDEGEGLDLVARVSARATAVAKHLVDVCARHPLAIRIAAIAIDEHPDVKPDWYVQQLLTARKKAELLDASVQLSIASFTDTKKRRFFMLFVFSSDFDVRAVAAVWSIDIALARIVVSDLRRRGLIEWNEDFDRYRIHDLIRASMESRIKPRAARKSLMRYSSHFGDICREADAMFEAGGDGMFDAVRVFDLEINNIESGFRFASSNFEADEDAARICSDYVHHTRHLGRLRHTTIQVEQWLRIGISAAERVKDAAGVEAHTGNLGRVLRDLGRAGEALECHQKILETSLAKGALGTASMAALQIGNTFLSMSKKKEAAEKFEEALQLAKQVGYRVVEANASNNLGTLWWQLGRQEEADRLVINAVDLFEEIGDLRSKAMASINLADVFVRAGKLKEAETMLAESLEVVEKFDDTFTMHGVARSLASVKAEMKDVDGAMVMWSRAAELSNRRNDLDGEISALVSLASLVLSSDTIPSAIHAERLAELGLIQDDALVAAIVHSLSGDLFVRCEKFDEALSQYGLATVRLESGGPVELLSTVLWNKGLTLAKLGNAELAVECLRQSIGIEEDPARLDSKRKAIESFMTSPH